MNIIRNSDFQGTTVDLDGAAFYDCTFRGCTLRYSGGAPPTMVRCHFHGTKFEFAGSAANTVAFMRGIYHGLGDSGQEIIEATFDQIRDKQQKPRGQAEKQATAGKDSARTRR